MESDEEDSTAGFRSDGGVEGSSGTSDSDGYSSTLSSGDESSDEETSDTERLSSSLQSNSSSSTDTGQSSSPFTSSSSSDTDHSSMSSDDEPCKLKSLCKSLLESKTPLYPESQVSVLDSYILLYEYALRHSLTKEAFKELIELVTVHMPSNAKSAKSVYLLQNFFEKHFNDTKGECHYYCTKCHRCVEEGARCPSGCDARINKFLYVPIEPQLKRRLEGAYTNIEYSAVFSILDSPYLHVLP
jgi:hypothetical protein